MNRFSKKSLIAFSILAAVTLSCNFGDLDFDNIEDPTFTPEVAAPIGEVTYTIKELIEEINDPLIDIDEASSGLISIVYRDTSVFQSADRLIQIDEIGQQQVIEPGVSVSNSPNNMSIPFNQTVTFNYTTTNGENLDSLIYSGGQIQVELQSQIAADVNLQMDFVDFVNVDTREQLVLNSSMAFSGTLPVADTQISELTGLRCDLSSNSEPNTFEVVFSGTVDMTAGQSVDITDFITATITTSNSTYEVVFGYFGEDEIVIQDQSIEMDFFQDIAPNGLEFEDPEIRINIQNSFGLPIGLNLDQISSENDDGVSANLTGDITTSAQDLRYPETSELGSSLASSFAITNENSNIQDLLDISPSRFNIPISANTNLGNSAQDPNFYTASSQIETIIEINLPLSVKLDGYSQTFDFNLSDVDFDDADSIRIRVTTINDLPFNGTMNLFLLDVDSTVIHSVPDNLILQSPEIGTDGRSTGSITNIEDVLLNTDGVMALPQSEEIVLVVNVESFEATDNRFVRIFSDYELVIKLGIIANIRYTP